MSDTPPVVPPNNAQAIVAALSPLPINLDEARKQQEQYKADLEKTRGALSAVQGQRQDVTTRNLRAIDEAITGLKESRTGTYGLDPAVTAALAAGFLTPRTGGNFLSELGSAMGNAAPVVKDLQTRDRDSFQILADLHRKRGEFEAQPLLEQQTELSAREKLEAAALKESEKALTRAPAGSTPAAQEKIELAKKKRIDDIIKRAQTDADNTTKGMMHGVTGKPLSITDRNKIQKYLTLEAIKDHNRVHKEGTPEWIDPAQFAMTEPEITEASNLADNAQPDDKGTHRDYHEYERSLKPGEAKLSKPEWEAQNAATKAVAVERAKEALAAESQLETVLASTATVKEIAQKLLTHPGLSGVTGNWAGIEKYPGVGNDQVAAIALFEQLKANEFLKAVPSLKGFGQLTEAEGKKLGASQNALARRMSTEGFRAELQNMIATAERLEARYREKLADKERKAGVSTAPKPAAGGGSGPGGTWQIGDRWTDPAGRKLIVAPDGTWQSDQ